MKLHQFCFSSFFNRYVPDNIQHFVFIFHFDCFKRFLQSVPVFTSKDNVVLVSRKIVPVCQIIPERHGTSFRQTFIRCQCSFRRCITDNIQTVHFHIRIGLQLIDHLADFSQFLRIIHVFGTNIDFIHLEIQKTFCLNIPLFDFFRFRLQISKLRNHYVRRPYTFQRHFAKLLYVHQFRFAATTFITLHVQTRILHP